MTKCDFCTMSKPNGKCYWSSQIAAEDDCKKAIKRMISALRNVSNEKNNSSRRTRFR